MANQYSHEINFMLILPLHHVFDFSMSLQGANKLGLPDLPLFIIIMLYRDINRW